MIAQAVTDVGLERKVNQDYVYYSLTEVGNLPNLFIVADGMGGHKAGDMASRFTVDTLVALIKNSDKKDPIIIINDAVNEVNRLLLLKAQESEEYEGMGTTLVVASVFDDELKVANIGDSRLYIVNGGITQITRDHSLVEEMVTLGEINRSEARTHSRKNIITRAIGCSEQVEAEIFSIDLKKNDRILMCTDGLTNMLEDEAILEIINNENDISVAATKLVDAANECGGRDNISVIIIEP